MNLNLELFKKYKPEKKLEIINSCSIDDLFNIRESTILRMIKEAGTGDNTKARNKFKSLRLINRTGNGWNSIVEGVYNTKEGIFADVYIQGDDTDTNDSCNITDLLISHNDTVTLGYIDETFSNGYSHRCPARYDREDRASVIQEICISYVRRKYNI